MSETRKSRYRPFRRAVFGYRRSAVDGYLSEVEVARSSLEAEVERLRPVEPLTRVGDDVAALLTSFAETVSVLRDQIGAEADQLRLDAEAYAEHRKAEADQMVEDARRMASAAAEELVGRARADVAALADHQLTIGEALDRAADTIAASKLVLSHLAVEAQGGTLATEPETPVTIRETRPREPQPSSRAAG